MNETISAKKRSPLVTVLTMISLLLGILGVFCVALSMIVASLIAGYRSSQWFMVVAPVLALFPLSLLLTAFQSTSLLFGASAVLASWFKRARKTLPLAAVALALVEIAAVRVSMGRFALQNPVYSMYLHLDSTQKHRLREFTQVQLTPLMKAAEAGRTEEVRTLLREGADPFEKCMPGWTACGLAVRDGRVETVKAFLENDAVASDRNYLGTLLRLAAEHDRIEITRLLVEKNAIVDKSAPTDDWTPLMYASSYGHEEVADILLEHGADINHYAPSGTPLGIAAYAGQLKMVTKLLDAGADINAQSAEGYTPLMTVNCSSPAAPI